MGSQMPLDEVLDQTVRVFLVGLSVGNLVYYVGLSAALWWLFRVAFQKQLGRRKISSRDPVRGQISREIWQSFRSIAIWAVINMAVIAAASRGWTRFYGSVDEYGWGWFASSIGLMVIIHDAYFYWSHRLMHHPRLYRLVHQAHHLSTCPTVWGSYAFSPLEAVVQAGICPLVILTMPVHPGAYAIFMVFQIGITVFGHLGYEIFPAWFWRSGAQAWVNSITHHTLHHEKYRSCYGLYFNFWDRLMGTNHASYAERFEQATTNPPDPGLPVPLPALAEVVEDQCKAPLRKAG